MVTSLTSSGASSYSIFELGEDIGEAFDVTNSGHDVVTGLSTSSLIKRRKKIHFGDQSSLNRDLVNREILYFHCIPLQGDNQVLHFVKNQSTRQYFSIKIKLCFICCECVHTILMVANGGYLHRIIVFEVEE